MLIEPFVLIHRGRVVNWVINTALLNPAKQGSSETNIISDADHLVGDGLFGPLFGIISLFD
jgi:hypothetical protein